MSDRSKEFRLTADQFQRIRRRISDYAGISLAETKQDMVYGRLIRRLRALGCAGFDDYLERVEGDVGGERQRFVNALTTNLTAFFREAHHFEVLREVLAGYGRQRLRIWCSAASTGEEPQSIAMTVVEHYRSWTPPVEIIATDIDTQVLDQCRQGVYPIERIDELSTAVLSPWHRADGRQGPRAAGAGAAYTFRAVQSAGAGLVEIPRCGRRVLSQRHDLFRQADADPGAAAVPSLPQSGRLAVRRPLREPGP